MTNYQYILSVFKNELALIHSAEIKEIVINTLLCVDPMFFKAPASSSGKYHAADECEEGGLILHTKRVVKCANFLAQDPDYYKDMRRNNFMPYDGLIAAAILHDCVKGGKPWGDHTANNHPQLAAALVTEINGITPITMAISRTIKTHMGFKWGERTWGDPINAPETLCQKLLHKADMLASRKWISIDIDDMEI